jgi:hypothetical protein
VTALAIVPKMRVAIVTSRSTRPPSRTRGSEARTPESVAVSAARAYARRKRRSGYFARASAVSSECIVA